MKYEYEMLQMLQTFIFINKSDQWLDFSPAMPPGLCPPPSSNNDTVRYNNSSKQ